MTIGQKFNKCFYEWIYSIDKSGLKGGLSRELFLNRDNHWTAINVQTSESNVTYSGCLNITLGMVELNTIVDDIPIVVFKGNIKDFFLEYDSITGFYI